MPAVPGFPACILSPCWATPENLRHRHYVERFKHQIHFFLGLLQWPLSTWVCKSLSYPPAGSMPSLLVCLFSVATHPAPMCLAISWVSVHKKTPVQVNETPWWQSTHPSLFCDFQIVNNKNPNLRKCEYLKSKDYVLVHRAELIWK